MKYTENNRVSHRQLYRQIILSFLAPLLICIPGNDGEQGLSGAVGIMAAVLILLLYVFFLIRTSYCYADPVKIMGKLKGSLLGSFFLIYLIMTGVGSIRDCNRMADFLGGCSLCIWGRSWDAAQRADGRCLGRNFFICDHTYAAVVYRAGECRIFERNAAGKSIVGKGDSLQHV